VVERDARPKPVGVVRGEQLKPFRACRHLLGRGWRSCPHKSTYPRARSRRASAARGGTRSLRRCGCSVARLGGSRSVVSLSWCAGAPGYNMHGCGKLADIQRAVGLTGGQLIGDLVGLTHLPVPEEAPITAGTCSQPRPAAVPAGAGVNLRPKPLSRSQIHCYLLFVGSKSSCRLPVIVHPAPPTGVTPDLMSAVATLTT
jgi:hypothetical protein